MTSKFFLGFRSRSDQAFVKCAKQTNLIHGGSTTQLTSLAAKVLVPDTTSTPSKAFLNFTDEVHASIAQSSHALTLLVLKKIAVAQ